MKLVKAYGNAKLGNGPRKPKESKRAQDAQGKTNGTKELESDEMGRGCLKE